MTRATGVLVALCLVLPGGAGAQLETTPERLESLVFEPLRFEQPEPERREVLGVPVLVLPDRDLPLVTALVGFEGGYGLFPRSHYAAGTALPSLLRYGGVVGMPPDSVDAELETYAIQLSFGSGGGSISSSMNVLREHFERSMDLWGRMLTDPAFDADEVDIWRGRQVESILRRSDDPGSLAFSEFNRLLYGDHPIGWEMGPGDLDPDVFTRERLGELHGRIVCRENLLIGLTGDVSWTEAREVLEAFVARVPECTEPLPEPPVPDVRRKPGVYLIHKELDQSVIVMAHPTDLPLADDPEYFSATIGNAILGGGGFSSRIMDRVRTERGYAYSASSLWTTPRRHPGLVGAVTRTRPETAVPAAEVILETMRGLGAEPPTEEEVSTTIDRIVNGFVFNFETAAQIVSRTMFYLAQELPDDWLERYMRGVQAVGPEDVADVFEAHLRPDDMTLLIVGDTTRIGRERLETLGPVTVLPTP
ncbi:MAG: pitrilysin family protein [Gemmatimonadota bacterium]